MIKDVLKYIKIAESIEEIINQSNIRVGYIIKQSGIIPSSFYRKLKEKSFTAYEILNILKAIKPKKK